MLDIEYYQNVLFILKLVKNSEICSDKLISDVMSETEKRYNSLVDLLSFENSKLIINQ